MYPADRTFANNNNFSVSHELILTCSTFTYYFVHFPALKGILILFSILFWCQSSYGSIMCLYVFGGGGVWPLQKPQEIRLALMEQPAKEATLSWCIMTRWKSGWLLRGTHTHTLKLMYSYTVGEAAGVGGQGAHKQRRDVDSDWCGPICVSVMTTCCCKRCGWEKISTQGKNLANIWDHDNSHSKEHFQCATHKVQ